MAVKAPTRDRIVSEATRLFAAHGIRATTVAQIEAAVGLRPGSGGLHRHFATKDDLIRAVLDRQLQQAEHDVGNARTLPAPTADNTFEYLRALGTLIVTQAEGHRDVALIMLRDAHNLPDGVLDEQHRRNFDATYRTIADALAHHDVISTQFGMDADALAFLLAAPLIYHRLIEWATGSPVLDLDADRLIDTWARLFEPVVKHLAPVHEAAPDSSTNEPAR